MNQVDLMNHISNNGGVNYMGVAYSYDKETRMFKNEKGERFSLDFAITQCSDLCPSVGVDFSLDRDYGVIATIKGETIIDVKTEAHL